MMNFRMKTKRTNVIYWRGNRIYAAAVDWHLDEWRIACHEMFDGDLASADELKQSVRCFIRTKKMTTGSWIAMVSQSDVLWKQLTVPSHHHEEVVKMVRLAVQSSAWDDAECVCAHHVMSLDPDGCAQVLAGIVQQDLLSDRWGFLKAVGISGARWTVDALALRTFAVTSAQDVMMLNAGSEEVQLVCFTNQHPVLGKVIPAGDTQGLCQQAALFVALSLERYKDKAFQLEMLVLNRHMDDLEILLKERLSIPVCVRSLSYDDIQGVPLEGQWLSVLGGALVRDCDIFDWVPADVRQAALKQQWINLWVRFTGLILAVVVLAGSLAGMNLIRKTAYRNVLLSKMTTVQREISLLEQMSKRLDELHDRAEGRMFLSDVLARLDQLRNPAVVIHRLEWVGRDGLVLQGAAGDEAQVNDFQKQLIASRLFNDVALQYVQRKQSDSGVYFKIRCLWEQK